MKRVRPSPSQSATAVDVHTVEMGSDGRFWKALPSGTTQRWSRIAKGIKVEICWKGMPDRDENLTKIIGKQAIDSSIDVKTQQRCLRFRMKIEQLIQKQKKIVDENFYIRSVVDEASQLSLSNGKLKKLHKKAKLTSAEALQLKMIRGYRI